MMEDEGLPTLSTTDRVGTLSQYGSGMKLSFPPKGVLRTYRGHLGISILIILAGFSVLLIREDPSDASLLRLVCAIFVSGGLYLLVTTIRAGRTRTIVVAGEDGLTVENVNPLFSTRQSWSRSKVESIKLHGYRAACVSVGGRDLRLAVDQNRSDVIRLIATVRRGLGMSRKGSQRPVRPEPSQIVWNKTGDVATIGVPNVRAPLVIVALGVLALLALLIWRMANPVAGDQMSAILMVIAVLVLSFIAFVLLLRKRMESPTVFEVSHDELTVIRPFLFGRRRYKWTREQIEDVTAAQSIVVLWRKKNFRPVQIRLGVGPSELTWIAEVIRHEMDLLADLGI